ncbi:hypothetical protein JB92DRAFT_2868806 [Gautieria morchelliformis]|nr:hypothetical protein JB92DRAFT_2868806 [Gautieria morchelliformis]
MDDLSFKIIGREPFSFPQVAPKRSTNAANTNAHTPSLLARMTQAQGHDSTDAHPDPHPNEYTVDHPTRPQHSLHNRLGSPPSSPSAASARQPLSERISAPNVSETNVPHAHPNLLNRLSTPGTPGQGDAHVKGSVPSAAASLSARISPPSAPRFHARVQQEQQEAMPAASLITRTKPQVAAPSVIHAEHATMSTVSAPSTTTVPTKEIPTRKAGKRRISSPIQAMDIDAASASPTPPPLTPSPASSSPVHFSPSMSSPHAVSPHAVSRAISAFASPHSMQSPQLQIPSTNPDPANIPTQFHASSHLIPSSCPPANAPETPSKQVSNAGASDMLQTPSNPASLGSALAYHMSPLWAESAAQAREWGEVAEAKAKGLIMQEPKSLDCQSLHSGRVDGGEVKATSLQPAKLTTKRTRDVDVHVASEKNLEPVHDEPPHKRVKASVEEREQAPAPPSTQASAPPLVSSPPHSSANRDKLRQMDTNTPRTSDTSKEGHEDSAATKDECDESAADTELSEVEDLEAIKAIEARERERLEREKEIKRLNLEQELAILRREEERAREAEKLRKEEEAKKARKEAEKEAKLRKEREEEEKFLKEREQRLRDEVQRRRREMAAATAAVTSGLPTTDQHGALGKKSTPALSGGVTLGLTALSGGVTLGLTKQTSSSPQMAQTEFVPSSTTSMLRTQRSVLAPATSTSIHPSPALLTAKSSPIGPNDVAPASPNIAPISRPASSKSNSPGVSKMPAVPHVSKVAPVIRPIPTSCSHVPLPAPTPPVTFTEKVVKREAMEHKVVLDTSTGTTGSKTTHLEVDVKQEEHQSVTRAGAFAQVNAGVGIDSQSARVDQKPKIKSSPSASPAASLTGTPTAAARSLAVPTEHIHHPAPATANIPAPVTRLPLAPPEPEMTPQPEAHTQAKLIAPVPTLPHPPIVSAVAPVPASNTSVHSLSRSSSTRHTPAVSNSTTADHGLKRPRSPSIVGSASKRMREIIGLESEWRGGSSMSIDTECLELTYPDATPDVDEAAGWGGHMDEDDERRSRRRRRERSEEERSPSPVNRTRTPRRRIGSLSRSRSPLRSPLPRRGTRRSRSPEDVSPASPTAEDSMARFQGPRSPPRSGLPRVRPRSPNDWRRLRHRSPPGTRPFDHWSPPPPRGVGNAYSFGVQGAPDRGYADRETYRRTYTDRPLSPPVSASRYERRPLPSPVRRRSPPQPVRARTPTLPRDRTHFSEQRTSRMYGRTTVPADHDWNDPPARDVSPPLRPSLTMSVNETHGTASIPSPERPTSYELPPSQPQRLPPHHPSLRASSPHGRGDRTASNRFSPPDDAVRSTSRFQPHPDTRSLRTSSYPAPHDQPRDVRLYGQPNAASTPIDTQYETRPAPSLTDRLSTGQRSVKKPYLEHAYAEDTQANFVDSTPRRGRGAPRGRRGASSGRTKLKARLSDAPTAGNSLLERVDKGQ